jgi:hypothetical protein
MHTTTQHQKNRNAPTTSEDESEAGTEETKEIDPAAIRDPDPTIETDATTIKTDDTTTANNAENDPETANIATATGEARNAHVTTETCHPEHSHHRPRETHKLRASDGTCEAQYNNTPVPNPRMRTVMHRNNHHRSATAITTLATTTRAATNSSLQYNTIIRIRFPREGIATTFPSRITNRTVRTFSTQQATIQIRPTPKTAISIHPSPQAPPSSG